MVRYTPPPPLSEEELRKVFTEAQVPQVLNAPRIRTPTLVVLLGTTPARASLELMRHLLTLDKEDRDRVVCVYIDTDDEDEGLVRFRDQHEGAIHEITQRVAVPAGISHAAYPDDRAVRSHTFIPPAVPKFFANGAGGIRNNGHVAAAFDWSLIDQTLNSGLAALRAIGTEQDARRVREVQVDIVAFCGGGTGSGIVGDMAVAARQLLISNNLQHRLNIFCILPELVSGADQVDGSWRKSNAVAALLELVALSLAGTVQNDVYPKYMLHNVAQVSGDPVANEIYLLGRTQMSEPDDAARIVGLDLFQRITDSSGVGALEHSTWVNRRFLGSADDRLLPTMFGTTCPMEVRFPAQETAHAFAQISASYLLEHLVGQQPPTPVVTPEWERSWTRKWNEVGRVVPKAAAGTYQVTAPTLFTESEFTNVADDTFVYLWSQLTRRVDEVSANIGRAVDQAQNAELQRIFGQPEYAGDPEVRSLSTTAQQAYSLLKLRSEYQAVLGALERRPPAPARLRPVDAEHNALNPLPVRVPVVADLVRPRYVTEVFQTYNQTLAANVARERYEKLHACLQALIKQVDQELASVNEWDPGDIEARARALYSDGSTSPAYLGTLEPPHPHQRHLFDLRSLRSQRDQRGSAVNLAVQRLYLRATFPEGAPGLDGQTQQVAFDQALRQKFLARCTHYIHRQAFDDDSSSGASGDGEQGARTLGARGKARLADMVVGFFEEYYLHGMPARDITDDSARGWPGFATMNLFELLKIGTGERGTALSAYLLQHLQHINGLMSSLIAFEPTLYHGGAHSLDTTLYLGVRWDTSAERGILDRALHEHGPFTESIKTPRIANLIDPHRLQLSYGQHGISLSTIPEFYREHGSMMEEYLRHQGEWFGDRQRILPEPRHGVYGRNKMPVHSSGEMERLVCSQDALRYHPPSAVYGAQQKIDRSLRGRVIRDIGDLSQPTSWSGS